MDEKIITQFEVNVLVKDESTEAILRILKAHNAEVLAEKPVQKIRLSYDIKKQQYAFFVTFEISAPREEERGIRKDLSLNEQVIRLLITEKKEKKGAERRGIEAQKKPSRLKSALQAMLPNEALEKKIEEILQ
ncbi:MAG: 30S ribosomal protein S6 [Candidatus Paceibacterota bacterium]|jgi:ribosomal protein S6